MYDYVPLGFFVFFSFLISFILPLLSFILSTSIVEPEKVSTYECGFNPFEDARTTYDVKFYIVAMVFIIFDVEVALLIPWVFAPFALAGEGVFAIFGFLLILVFGFVYEWEKDVLVWA